MARPNAACYREAMDEALTLVELCRLEAERKLRAISLDVLETAFVREAQIEAVIDAVLAVTYASSPEGLAHARHVGEFCARIAANLQFGPDPSFARRVGVLCDLDPSALASIPELDRFASYIRDYQATSVEAADEPTTMSLIVHVADEFDRVVTHFAREHGRSPSVALRRMIAESDADTRRIVEALAKSIPSKSTLVA